MLSINFFQAVAKQFDRLRSMGRLYRTTVASDDLWATYQGSFPEGTNLIYRVRPEHDCSTCRSFFKAAGNVVAIDSNLDLVSIWDFPDDADFYNQIAEALSKQVKASPVGRIFLHRSRTAGAYKSFEQILGQVHTWNHLFINIPRDCISEDIPAKTNEAKTLHDVFLRSCRELSTESVEAALEMISQNSLYRGEENKFALESFLAAKKSFDRLPEERQDNFAWLTALKLHPAVAKIKNSAIGTLLENISNGMELDAAVRSFDTIAAPMNYQRPTAVATRSMIESAKDKIEELGLSSAMDRRCATLADISINDILFADRSAKRKMSGSVFDDLLANAPGKTPKNLDKAEEIQIEKLISDIVPNASSIEVFFDSKLSPNLVALVAPSDPTAGSLFKWGNNFSWCYKGSVADSIKERVKQAGGEVNADICCRLAWFNTDDLDLHLVEPDKYHIYFGSRGVLSGNGGTLDVDMNVSSPLTTTPVENIFYSSSKKMKPGVYSVYVHSYNQRNNTDPGFIIEIDVQGAIHSFSYDRLMRQGDKANVANIVVDPSGIKVEPLLPLSISPSVSKSVWGLSTEAFHKVSALMLSPNFWESPGIGNKHYFFMLDGCESDEPVRCFFNEYLKESLSPHRKVFELAGSKMMAPSTPGQLSGLGFSSTKRAQILCRVSGKFNRLLKVNF